MKIIAGLGNPGKKYETTRHNVGFIVADLIGEELGVDITEKNFNGLTAEVFYQGQKVILVKPQTYMNLSGQCVGELARYYKVDNEDILAISDDLSLPVGTMKLRPKGSSGGHNGLKSLIAHLDGDDFPRLKLGIGYDADVIDHVLGHFSEGEWQTLTTIMKKAVDCSLDWLNNGVDEAMCHYNMYSKLPKPPKEKASKEETEEKNASPVE
ncbi:MAG: aminoacyl-tRNA hydrolase [Bacillota bacterium]|nr:aminoacyl-tRNA hydrolase [Bacillota bacterium]